MLTIASLIIHNPWLNFGAAYLIRLALDSLGQTPGDR